VNSGSVFLRKQDEWPRYIDRCYRRKCETVPVSRRSESSAKLLSAACRDQDGVVQRRRCSRDYQKAPDLQEQLDDELKPLKKQAEGTSRTRMCDAHTKMARHPEEKTAQAEPAPGRKGKENLEEALS